MNLAKLFALIAKLGPKLSDPVLWAAIQAIISWFKSLTEDQQEAYLSKFETSYSSSSPFGATDSPVTADFPADCVPAENALLEACQPEADKSPAPVEPEAEPEAGCDEDPDCPCDESE